MYQPLYQPYCWDYPAPPVFHDFCPPPAPIAMGVMHPIPLVLPMPPLEPVLYAPALPVVTAVQTVGMVASPQPQTGAISQQTARDTAATATASRMADSKADDNISVLVAKQGDLVRSLKAAKAPKEEILAEVEKLKALKAQLQEELKSNKESDMSAHFDRAGFENLLKRRCFVIPSFEIYGGVAGLYDFGPPGCAVKTNILALWRRHFVIEENMLEVDCTAMTPEIVLQTSGHCARFSDFMVKDMKTHDCHRADHLLEDHMDKMLADPKITAEQREECLSVRTQADNYGAEELGEQLRRFKVLSPDGNEISEPYPFNLMFGTQIGPTGTLQGYLRPETAQGIFVNFRRLLEYNAGKLPFSAAQIGQAFRNEIAPRWGLLRVREFTMGEIEHFVHPEHKDHPKFERVADLVVSLYGRDSQMTTREVRKMTLRDAIKEGLIANETLAYFLGRTHQFLLKCGINEAKMRFRQHLTHEMAHYACDCWDAEIETSFGWVECVGHADRSCYDLEVHSKKSKVDLMGYEAFDAPKVVDVVEAVPNKGLCGKTFGKANATLLGHLKELPTAEAEVLAGELESKGSVTIKVGENEFPLTGEMIKFVKKQKKEHGRNFYPHVIEPSFGIGRILYAALEHSYFVREGDEARKVLSFSPWIAPVKCSVLPLSSNAEFADPIKDVSLRLVDRGLTIKVDESAQSIGRRYARTDEIGVPFGITVDFDTKKDNTVTLRSRDSCEQVRGPVPEIVDAVANLCVERTTWAEVRERFPLVKAPVE